METGSAPNVRMRQLAGPPKASPLDSGRSLVQAAIMKLDAEYICSGCAAQPVTTAA